MAQERKPAENKDAVKAKPRIDVLKESVDTWIRKEERQSFLNNELRKAAEVDDKFGVNYLIETGADPNSQSGSGWTALMLAAKNGHMDTCYLLIRNGAKIDIENNRDNTAITLAGKHGHKGVVLFLRIMVLMGQDMGMDFLHKLKECRQSVKAIAE